MKAVITGDIINSRKSCFGIMDGDLKDILKDYGNEPKDWEIYRGDSFQLIINPVDVTHENANFLCR
jgi:hypothetical protein